MSIVQPGRGIPGMGPRVNIEATPTRERPIDRASIPPPVDAAEFAHRLSAEMPALTRFVRRLCGRRDDADDLGQDAARRALEFRASYDAARPLRPWLFRVAFRVWLDRGKRVGRGSSVEISTLPAPSRDPAENMRLRDALAQLSAVERDLLVALHVRRDSIAEIARRHAMPENTVKSHLHRARNKLMDLLEDGNGPAGTRSPRS